MKKIYTAILIILCSYLTSSAQPAITITPFATGFINGITDITSAGDGRLFVTEQLGYISIVDSLGNVSPAYFLDISSKVTPTSLSNAGEQGLLGIAFSPNYASDGVFYVNYTSKEGTGNTVIARYKVSANPDLADPNSEEILLEIYQPYSNHNGGSIKFGPDGYLYCAMGDGGDAGDPGNRAQNTDSLLGKILRIDVSPVTGYSIPASNPFATGGGAPEIWSLGLRNPWRISFDRLSGHLWIGDVGQGTVEEIDFQPAASTGGENYGWRCYEGNSPYNTTGCGPFITYTPPAYEYTQASTGGCSVTGGFVYRGTLYPDLTGYYFYSDFCNSVIYSLDGAFNSTIAGSFAGNNFTTFGENSTGELFVGSRNNGIVYSIESLTTAVNETVAEKYVSIYPSPNSGLFNCDINLLKNSDAELIITDLSGRQLISINRQLAAGLHSLPIQLENVDSGMYLLKLTTNNDVVYESFQVIK